VISSQGFFGQQVALSGNDMVVVAKNAPYSGAVVYYKFENDVWIEKQHLMPFGDTEDIQYAADIILDNDTLVIGAPSLFRNKDNNAVYIYRLIDNRWILEQKIDAFSLGSQRFGSSVSYHNDALVFSAEECDFSFSDDDCAVEFIRTGDVWAESEIIGIGDGLNKLILKNNELYISSSDYGTGYVNYYKKTIDGWHLNQTITGSDGLDYDYFGHNFSIFGSYLAVGAYGHDGEFSNQGAVYVFTRNQNNNQWQELIKLSPENGDLGHNFGFSLSLYNNQLLVGSGYDALSASLSSQAYLFEKIGTQWSYNIVPSPSYLEQGRFSHSVAINNHHMIISEPQGGNTSFGSGVLHSYKDINQNWTYQSEIVPLKGNRFAKFGADVDSEKDLLFVSAPTEVNENNQLGSVYVYKKDTDEFVLETKITSPDAYSQTNFGYEVDGSSDWLAVSSPFDSEIAHFSGAVFMYRRDNGWQFEQKIVPSVVEDELRLGYSIALAGNTLALGAPNKKINDMRVGSVYIYELVNNHWIKTSTIQPNENITSDQFGKFVALQGDHLLIASDKNYDISGNGEIDIYQRINTEWVHRQRFTDLNLNYWKIGEEIIIENDTVAFRMVSYAANSGMVGVLKFNGNNWGDFQLIYPNDFTPDNKFGTSIAIEQNTIYVGASENNDFGFRSGAVYQFNRIADNWHQSQKIHSFDQLFGIGFGYSQALSEGMLCMGAPYDSQIGPQAGAIYCQKSDVIFYDDFE